MTFSHPKFLRLKITTFKFRKKTTDMTKRTIAGLLVHASYWIQRDKKPSTFLGLIFWEKTKKQKHPLKSGLKGTTTT